MTIPAIMDEIKNMLDYKVGHYIHYNDITSANKQNVLRSFVFIKQKVFPNGQLDKLEARRVADGSQQGRNLNDFVSSVTVSLQVVYLLFNITSYYECILQTVDIRGIFLNAMLQLHLSRMLVDVGYKQSINYECLFYKNKGSKFSYVSTHSDDLLHCVHCSY